MARKLTSESKRPKFSPFMFFCHVCCEEWPPPRRLCVWCLGERVGGLMPISSRACVIYVLVDTATSQALFKGAFTAFLKPYNSMVGHLAFSLSTQLHGCLDVPTISVRLLIRAKLEKFTKARDKNFAEAIVACLMIKHRISIKASILYFFLKMWWD